MRPEFRLRVRLPIRLLKNVEIGLPEAHLPNTSVEVRLLKVYFPKVRLQVASCNVCLPMGHLRWILLGTFTIQVVYVNLIYQGNLPENKK